MGARKRSFSFEKVSAFTPNPSETIRIVHDTFTGAKKVYVNDLCVFQKKRKWVEGNSNIFVPSQTGSSYTLKVRTHRHTFKYKLEQNVPMIDSNDSLTAGLLQSDFDYI